jgi:N-acetylmuramoyl-L-alanine amidase-like protein
MRPPSGKPTTTGPITRLATGITIAILMAAWSAAGTASASSRVPAPVEFQRPAPASPAAASAGADRTIRGLVRTGRHFNLVGFRWRGDAAESLAVRVRSARGWGRWTAVPVEPEHGPDVGAAEHEAAGRGSDPVWAGESRAVQYRMRSAGRLQDLRLKFVNTAGTATAAGRAHRVQASIARPISPAPGVPAIVTRDEWGASKCPPRATPSYGEVQLAFVHHTVTANDYGPADSAAMVRAVCVYHRNSNGWNDIGYNLLVDKYGQVFEGRAGGIDAPVVGAQAQGYNAQSTGIANLGTFSTTGQTAAGLDALARILSWKLAVHGVPPTGEVQVVSTGGSLNRYPAGAKVTFQRISGHRDGDATSCPGDGLYGQLPAIRQMATGGPLPVLASVTLSARSRTVTYGSKAALTGRLRTPAGTPVEGQPLDVQLLGRSGSWNSIQSLRTDFGGTITTNVRLTYNHAFRGWFPGGPGLASMQSKPVTIGVRPLITARLRPTSAAVFRRGSRVSVRGTVKPAKRTALLLVDRLGPTDKRRVGRRLVKVRRGQARGSFRFERRGQYALRLATTPDAKNIGGRSKAIPITVR